MNLPRRLMALNLKPMLASALVAAAALTGVAVLGTNPDAVVAQSFATALAEPVDTAAAPIPVAGTEDFWLGKAHAANPVAIEPVAWAGPVSGLTLKVGDRITVTSGKTSRALEIVAIAEARARADAHGAGTSVVTARDTATPGAPLVTFTTPTAAAPAKTAEAL